MSDSDLSDSSSAGASPASPPGGMPGGPNGSGTPPTPDAVRAAAQRVKDAIDSHLAAVEARSGEQDPAVQSAFETLQSAAEIYDDLLYEAYDEVTPFEVGGVESGPPDLADIEIPPVVSLFLRRDYALADPDALLEAGRGAHRAIVSAGMAGDDEPEPDHLGAALYVLFQAAGVDGFDENAEDSGLEPLRGTVWFVAGDDGTVARMSDPGADPFDDADASRLIYRVDEVVGVDDDSDD